MNTAQLNRLIQLVKRTGDKTVVLDPASDAVLVLMLLESYEDLLGSEFSDDLDPNDLGTVKDLNEDLDDGLELLEDEEDDFDAPRHFSGDKTSSRSANRRPVESTKKLEFDDHWVGEHQPGAKHSTMGESPTVPALNETPEEPLTGIPHDEEEERFYLEPVE